MADYTAEQYEHRADYMQQFCSDEALEIKAMLRQAAQMMRQRTMAEPVTQWQPIETAPKDGTRVLVYPPTWPSKTCSIAHYNDDACARKRLPYWKRDDDLGQKTRSRSNPPTHWIPLPAAPNPTP